MSKTTTAQVKIMRSYDYCHFEINLGIEDENGISIHEVDDLRKVCARLVDKSVNQYVKAKKAAAARVDGEYKIQNFENQIRGIKAKDPQDRTVKEIAMLKQYEDEDWRAQFEDRYDYEDQEDDGLPF